MFWLGSWQFTVQLCKCLYGLVWWDRWEASAGTVSPLCSWRSVMEPHLWLADFQSYLKETVSVSVARGCR